MCIARSQAIRCDTGRDIHTVARSAVMVHLGAVQVRSMGNTVLPVSILTAYL